ncbi:hypothetical protein [Rouxiella sp. WC2420]|uniref:Uncharacterized protein n=1 Tax=Rouxiella sp. WC2420 TaxID=3234145 RepID=A0AB39VPP0_9GAMM
MARKYPPSNGREIQKHGYTKEYFEELNNHLKQPEIKEYLTKYFDIAWKARVYNHIRTNKPIFYSKEISYLENYLENKIKPRAVYWQNKVVGNLFLIPTSEKIITTSYDQQIETTGLLFSTTDQRVYNIVANGNTVSFLIRKDFDSFLASHLSLEDQENHQAMGSLLEKVKVNRKLVVEAGDTVRNTPRLTFGASERLSELHYNKFIENLQSDMDYLALSDSEIYWNSIFETMDSIGTSIAIASIPLSLGGSSHFAVAKLSHVITSLAITSVSTIIPKLIQSATADRPQKAQEFLVDALLALSSEGIGWALSKVLKSLPQIKISDDMIPPEVKKRISR